MKTTMRNTKRDDEDEDVEEEEDDDEDGDGEDEAQLDEAQSMRSERGGTCSIRKEEMAPL